MTALIYVPQLPPAECHFSFFHHNWVSGEESHHLGMQNLIVPLPVEICTGLWELDGICNKHYFAQYFLILLNLHTSKGEKRIMDATWTGVQIASISGAIHLSTCFVDCPVLQSKSGEVLFQNSALWWQLLSNCHEYMTHNMTCTWRPCKSNPVKYIAIALFFFLFIIWKS